MKTNYFLHKFCCVWPSKQTYRATVFHCLWPGNCTRLLSGNVDMDHGSRAGWDGSCGLRPLLSLALALRVQSASVTHFFYLCFREYLQMSIELVVVAVAAVCCYLCCCLFYSCCFCVLCRCYGSARFPAFPPFVLMASPPFYLLLLLFISLSLSEFCWVLFRKIRLLATTAGAATRTGTTATTTPTMTTSTYKNKNC